MRILIAALLILIAFPAYSEFSGDGCVIESKCFTVKRRRAISYTLYNQCNKWDRESYAWINVRSCGQYRRAKMVSHYVPSCGEKSGKIRLEPGRYKYMACSMGGFSIGN